MLFTFALVVDGGRREGRGGPGPGLVVAALHSLALMTGQDVTQGRTVSHHCLLCPIDGFVGTDRIVIVKWLNLSPSDQESPQTPQFSPEPEHYYEAQVALGVSGRESCYLVLLTSSDLYCHLVVRDLRLWTRVIDPALHSCSQ